jgi:hypothetical protein
MRDLLAFLISALLTCGPALAGSAPGYPVFPGFAPSNAVTAGSLDPLDGRETTFGLDPTGNSDTSAAVASLCAQAAANVQRHVTITSGTYNAATLTAAPCANVIPIGQGQFLASYRQWVFDPSLPSAGPPSPSVTPSMLPTFNSAKNPVVVLMGDSTCVDLPGANTVAGTEYLAADLTAKIRRDNAGRGVTIYNRCIGGQTWSSAHGTPTTNLPPWYLNSSSPWFTTYVAPLAPDLIIWDFSTNDAAALQSTQNASANMRATLALAKALPKVPDMIFVTGLMNSKVDPTRSAQTYQEYSEWVDGVVRSYATKNGYGLLDNGRQFDKATGFDPLDEALGCQVSTCPSTTLTPSSWPFVWPAATRDFSAQFVSNGDYAGFWNSLTSITFTLGQDPGNALILTNSGGYLAYQVIADNANNVSVPLTVATYPAGYPNAGQPIPVASSNGAGNAEIDISERTDGYGTHLTLVYSTIPVLNTLIDHAGGLFTPTVTLAGTVSDNVFVHNLTISFPQLYMPTLTDLELCGSSTLGSQFGGNGCPHFASRGNRNITIPVIEANTIGVNAPMLGTADNKLINGSHVLDQHNENISAHNNLASVPCTDKWFMSESFMAVRVACQRLTVGAPPGYQYYLSLSQFGTASALTAAQFTELQQTIEGPGIADLSWGTSGASPVHVGVWVQVNNAGAYDFVLKSNTGAGVRTFMHEVTLPANVWTYVSFAVPGDQASPGSWSSAHGASTGLVLGISAGCGTTWQTATLDAWQFASAALCTANSFPIAANTGAYIWMTGATLIKGGYDVPVAARAFGETLALAQRYFWKTFSNGVAPAQGAGLAGSFNISNPIAVGEPSGYIAAPVTMAAVPMCTTYNPSAANANWRDVTASADVVASVDPATAIGTRGLLLATSGTVTTLGDVLAIHVACDVGF